MDAARQVAEAVETVILGKSDVVRLAVVCLLSNGHLLIEDIPGVGKTMLARALSRSIGGVFKRAQFTPDLLPADLTGTAIFDQRTGNFEFREGPVFANVLLADEINRATPKTQSALLECMEERQVSHDGRTYQLPRPFLVIATENVEEYQGTFPLPEAQL
ncbi:MAG TPA: AAA family ATPase, partial [Armatimonadota bacterium]|nr:AAA family ATPase [Armatimonadota bacterium]